MVARIELLEADNKELKARLDNLEAEERKGHQGKGSGTKEPPATKPIVGKDSKRPETGKADNGRPSAPADKKPKDEEVPKPKPERPVTGKPGDKKPADPVPKPGVKKD